VRRLFVLALAGSLLATPALAAQEPKPTRSDERVRVVPYDADNVTRVTTTLHSEVVVEVSPEESDLRLAPADSADLLFVPYRNFMVIKPKRVIPMQPVTMFATRKDGAVRSYLITLEVQDAGPLNEQSGTVFKLRYIYPADAAATRAAAWRKSQAERREQQAAEALKAASAPAAPNWRYVAQGNRMLAPAEVWDDEQSTYFRFPGNQRIPAFFVIGPDGKEATVNYSVDGGLVTVHQTAAEFHLRDGDAVLTVFNRAYNSIGINPGTGTTTPDVIRTIKGAGS